MCVCKIEKRVEKYKFDKVASSINVSHDTVISRIISTCKSRARNSWLISRRLVVTSLGREKKKKRLALKNLKGSEQSVSANCNCTAYPEKNINSNQPVYIWKENAENFVATISLQLAYTHWIACSPLPSFTCVLRYVLKQPLLEAKVTAHDLPLESCFTAILLPIHRENIS